MLVERRNLRTGAGCRWNASFTSSSRNSSALGLASISPSADAVSSATFAGHPDVRSSTRVALAIGDGGAAGLGEVALNFLRVERQVFRPQAEDKALGHQARKAAQRRQLARGDDDVAGVRRRLDQLLNEAHRCG